MPVNECKTQDALEHALGMYCCNIQQRTQIAAPGDVGVIVILVPLKAGLEPRMATTMDATRTRWELQQARSVMPKPLIESVRGRM